MFRRYDRAHSYPIFTIYKETGPLLFAFSLNQKNYTEPRYKKLMGSIRFPTLSISILLP
jgi:hypothetical protein